MTADTLLNLLRRCRAALGATASVAAYLVYTLATQVLVLLPILAFAVAPQQSARPLKAA